MGERACGAYQVGALGLAVHGDGLHELDVEEARRLRYSLWATKEQTYKVTAKFRHSPSVPAQGGNVSRVIFPEYIKSAKSKRIK